MYGEHRDLHVLTHSVPTRRSADLCKLGGEHEEHKQHSSREHDQGRIARLLLLERNFGPLGREPRRQLGDKRIHGGERLAGRMARRVLPFHLDRGIEIVPGDAIGTDLVLERGDRTKNGRASCRERLSTYVEIADGAVSSTQNRPNERTPSNLSQHKPTKTKS